MSATAGEYDATGQVTELAAVRAARPRPARLHGVSIVTAMRAMERRAVASPPIDMAEWLANRQAAGATEQLADVSQRRADLAQSLIADVLKSDF